MNNNSKKTEKSFKKGDIILSEEPFAFVLKNKLRSERCDHCFKRTKLLKCTGCSYVHYCDRDCQKNGWEFHKYECHNIKRLFARVVPDSVRMLARIIMKLRKGGANERSYYTNSKFRNFRDLMSHYNEIKKDQQRIEHFISLNGVLHDYLEAEFIPNEAELLAIYGKMIVNTFNILDPEMQSIGTGMYLAASIIDHSCSPNAVAVFEGTKIYIRILEDLPKLEWDLIRISYIDLINLPLIRQKELQSTYYFLCQCAKCKDVEHLNYMTATLCQNEKCSKSILGGLLETTLSCSNCNEIISEETKNKFKAVVEFSNSQIEKMENMAYLDLCRICLNKQDKLFPSMNIYKVKILDLAMESCIALENWADAVKYGKKLEEPFRKYYGDIHPLRGIFLMKLGKISLLLNRIIEAKNYFKEATKILLITHGSRHSLIKEELYPCIRQCKD